MYHGGKARQAPYIGRAIRAAAQNRTRYLEPFVGGGNVLVRIPERWDRTASDIHHDLILMWQAVQTGWQPPAHITRDQYEAQRHAPPSPLRGFTGYACSWGAKWFDGYMTHTKIDLADATRRWLLTHHDRIASVRFVHADYRDWSPGADTVVYCDPPYRESTGYRSMRFDHDEFWATCDRWVADGAAVLVSEFTAPPGWVGTRTRGRYLSENHASHVPESLWRHREEHQPALGDAR